MESMSSSSLSASSPLTSTTHTTLPNHAVTSKTAPVFIHTNTNMASSSSSSSSSSVFASPPLPEAATTTTTATTTGVAVNVSLMSTPSASPMCSPPSSTCSSPNCDQLTDGAEQFCSRCQHAAAHERYMNEAIQVAIENVEKSLGGPFGAIIVESATGNIIARTGNFVVSGMDPTAHAEVQCIRAACASIRTHILTGYTMYSSCEPCPMCLSACHWARLDKVYFAASRYDAAEVGFDDELLYDKMANGFGDWLMESKTSKTQRLLNREHGHSCQRGEGDSVELPFHKIPFKLWSNFLQAPTSEEKQDTKLAIHY